MLKAGELAEVIAARLLRDANVQVADVVMLVGYIDLSSFSRLFQRWCGVSPNGFRKRIREAQRRAGAAPWGAGGL